MKRGKKPIEDQFTNLPVSRQRKWQLRKVAEGKCQICGNPGNYLCRDHMDSSRERVRHRNGYKKRIRSKFQPNGGKFQDIMAILKSIGETDTKMLAMMLGITWVSVYHYLNILKKEGKIERSWGKVRLA